jgi:hypothetical protein
MFVFQPQFRVGLPVRLLSAFTAERRLAQRRPSSELLSSLHETTFARFHRTLFRSEQNGDGACPPPGFCPPRIGQHARAECDSGRLMRSRRSRVVSNEKSACSFCLTAPLFASPENKDLQ